MFFCLLILLWKQEIAPHTWFNCDTLQAELKDGISGWDSPNRAANYNISCCLQVKIKMKKYFLLITQPTAHHFLFSYMLTRPVKILHIGSFSETWEDLSALLAHLLKKDNNSKDSGCLAHSVKHRKRPITSAFEWHRIESCREGAASSNGAENVTIRFKSTAVATSLKRFMKRGPKRQGLCRWHCRELTVIWVARWDATATIKTASYISAASVCGGE